jgi:endonuclease III
MPSGNCTLPRISRPIILFPPADAGKGGVLTVRAAPSPGRLIDLLGGMVSRELGIDLSGADSARTFRWLLAAKLMGARIPTRTAISTWREFDRRRVDTPEGILRTGWDGLVAILDAGGYTRYDFSTATKLLAIATDILERYRGDMNLLHGRSEGPGDLEKRLMDLGKGIGPVTANIFLREMRSVWPKADPALSPLALLAARDLGMIRGRGNPLEALRDVWRADTAPGYDFRDFEAALVRLGKDYCRKSRVTNCPMREACPKSPAYFRR